MGRAGGASPQTPICSLADTSRSGSATLTPRVDSHPAKRQIPCSHSATWGHRSAVSTRKGGGFYGFRLHAACAPARTSRWRGGVETAASHESTYVAPLLDSVKARGFDRPASPARAPRDAPLAEALPGSRRRRAGARPLEARVGAGPAPRPWAGSGRAPCRPDDPRQASVCAQSSATPHRLDWRACEGHAPSPPGRSTRPSSSPATKASRSRSAGSF